MSLKCATVGLTIDRVTKKLPIVIYNAVNGISLHILLTRDMNPSREIIKINSAINFVKIHLSKSVFLC